jgi:ribosomal protein S18 acetylase RimI-like enzyme
MTDLTPNFMEIRKAVPSDNGAARDLVRVSLSAFGIAADFDNLDRAIGLLGTIESRNSIELVAVIDGEIVGCLAIQRLAQDGAKLFGFHVDANSQGRGIGRALLSAAIAEAKAFGIVQLYLDTWDDMQAAVHLYETFGWQREEDPHPDSGANRSYVLALDGRPSK